MSLATFKGGIVKLGARRYERSDAPGGILKLSNVRNNTKARPFAHHLAQAREARQHKLCAAVCWGRWPCQAMGAAPSISSPCQCHSGENEVEDVEAIEALPSVTLPGKTTNTPKKEIIEARCRFYTVSEGSATSFHLQV